MRTVIVIPARYESSRFPAKPLAMLRGARGAAKPLVQRSYEAACAVPGIAAVYVATDHPAIADAATGFGAAVLMTSPDCRNGTERCAQACAALADPPDVVVNLQGDAPLTPAYFVTDIVAALTADDTLAMATPAIRCDAAHVRALQADEAAGRVGGTSVVVDAQGRALYFSKRLLPFLPEGAIEDGAATPVRLHIGAYAYRPAALAAYAATPPSALERLEGLEQLRFLDAGIAVRVVDVASPPWQVWELNNPSDTAPIEAALAAMGVD